MPSENTRSHNRSEGARGMVIRWGYRVAEIAERTGLSRDAVDREARHRSIPRKHVGAAVILEARARHLSGRNQQTQRLLEKALELADTNGYERGTARAHSELGALLTAQGEFKAAQEHLSAALRSDEGMGSQYRLDRRRQMSVQARPGGTLYLPTRRTTPFSSTPTL